MRDDVASLFAHRLSGKFSLDDIAGRSINISIDLPSGVLDAAAIATLKAITGGDDVSVEAKYRKAYSDQLRCKFLFGTNHPIELKTRDTAFANRIAQVPFFRSVPENQMDHDLLDKLLLEMPGILYHAITAYQQVIQRNYVFTGKERFGFKLNDIVLPTQPAESVGAFVSQCCQLDPEAFSTSEELHLAFLAFCRRTGLPPIEDRPSFSRVLKDYCGGQISSGKRRVNRTPPGSLPK